jgi:acyl dehydratase
MVDLDVRTIDDKIGQELGTSDWLEVTQETINQFADATGDHQWIHVDVTRVAESPFKTTIAHGFLTLSLVSVLLRRAMNPVGTRMAINYGVNRVRFVSPVPAGSRIRGRFVVGAVERSGGAIQVTWQVTIERDGGDRPCCVAEWIVRYYPTAA